MYDFQKMLEMADENIRTEEERLKEKKKKEEKEKEISRYERFEKERMSNTEELANSIVYLIIETLSNIKGKTGWISDISDILKHCGTVRVINQHVWNLDDEKFQIKLDFSWDSASCQYYLGPSHGFETDRINWEYLCKLLQHQGISLERKQSRYLKEIHKISTWNKIEYYEMVDILKITIERQKQLELDESNSYVKRKKKKK